MGRYKVIPFICTTVNDELNNTYRKMGFGLEVGEANGYVFVSKDHPVYGSTYDELNELQGLYAPGGWTYSDSTVGNEAFIELMEPIGPDLDKINIQDITDMWIFGWDSCHYNMNRVNYSKEIVKNITLELAEELSNFDDNLIKEIIKYE